MPRSSPPPSSSRQAWPRIGGCSSRPRRAAIRAGLLAAIAFALVFVGLLGYYGLRSSSSEPQQADGIPENIAPERPLLAGAQDIKIQIRDRKNPGRQAGELTFAGMDPVADQRHMVRVDQPRAWFAFNDGAWLSVRSPAGLVYMPDRQRPPESGTLSGGVVVRLFDPTPLGERPAESARAAVTFETESIDFDTLLNTLTTAKPWQASSKDLEATGQGLAWKFNAGQERTEYAEVTSNLRVVYTPPSEPVAARSAMPRSASPAPTATGPLARTTNTPPTALPPTPETPQTPLTPPSPSPEAGSGPMADTQTLLYRLVLEGAVKIEQEGREVTAPRLSMWARLINGRLPDDALTPIRWMEASPASALATTSTPSSTHKDIPIDTPSTWPTGFTSSQMGPSPTSMADAGMSASEPPIILTASGSTILRALDATPTELAEDHLAARFERFPQSESSAASHAESPRVKAIDAIQAATIDAEAIEYFATSRRCRLIGTREHPAVVNLLNQGTIQTERLDANLALGLIKLSGTGQLTSVQDPAASTGQEEHSPREQCLRWHEQGDLVLLSRDGQLAPALKQAIFTGQVVASDDAGESSLSGDHLRADFLERSLGSTQTVLNRVIVEGSGRATSSEGWLESERLVAEFERPRTSDAADATPPVSGVVATGLVRAQIRDAKLNADELQAVLAQDQRGRSIVREAIVSGQVIVQRRDGVIARAERIEAAPERELAELFGQGSSIERAGTRITGEQLRLDGQSRRIDVLSPGTLTHHDQAPRAGDEPAVAAQWLISMTYDDTTGQAICEGDVRATATQTEPLGRAYTKDTVLAERVRLELETNQDSPQRSGDLEASTRPVRRAVALGSIRDRVDGTRASIESRSIVAQADGPGRLERLSYIESEELEADRSASSAWARGPGKLLLLDERPPEPESDPQNAGGVADLGSTRGRTLFTWAGSGLVDQGAGRIELVRNVSLIHTPLGQGQDLLLDAERLLADVTFEQDASGRPSTQGRLRKTRAIGGVTLTYGPREIDADSLEYDAITGIVRAFAPPQVGGTLTILDRRTASPQTARSLIWNLRTDEFVIDDPGTLVTPR
jgi:lipopolysaccharide export system protein LptA